MTFVHQSKLLFKEKLRRIEKLEENLCEKNVEENSEGKLLLELMKKLRRMFKKKIYLKRYIYIANVRRFETKHLERLFNELK